MRTLSKAAVALLMLASFVLAPSAMAQGTLDPACSNVNRPSLVPNFTPPADPIAPIIETRVISGSFNYYSENGRSLTPVTVTITAVATDSSWATISVSPSTFPVPLSSNGVTDVPIPVKISVTLNAKAPAFATQTIRIEATATGGTCVVAPDKASDNIQIQADFYQRYNAQFDQTTFKSSQNDRVAIPLTITNIGNGPIEIRPVINAELTSKALDIASPGKITVNTQVQGADRDRETVNIEVQTPFKNGYVNSRHQVVINIEGNSADKPAISLTPVALNAVIQTQGVYVPGFDAVTLMGAAALGVALLARRRN